MALPTVLPAGYEKSRSSLRSDAIHVARRGASRSLCGAWANWTGGAVSGEPTCRRCIKALRKADDDA